MYAYRMAILRFQINSFAYYYCYYRHSLLCARCEFFSLSSEHSWASQPLRHPFLARRRDS